ncbi:Hypothetical protein HVR_LOCUS147 [uncultured virus]|nr:Hypothetical protein HVR_LOCUS147 [uncultured virus]
MSHPRQGRKTPKYYLEDWNGKSCCNKIVRNNRTVYVDIKYGKDRGELNKPSCPFNSINRAINAIRNIAKTNTTQWLVIVNPGVYDEVVDVPTFVNIQGSDSATTFIKSIFVHGTSIISRLSIADSNSLLVRTQLNNEQPNENIVLFQNVKVLAQNITNTQGNGIVSINGEGLNNTVTFLDCEIEASVTNNNPVISNQIVFDINATLVLVDVYATFLASYLAPVSFCNINGALTVHDAKFRLIVNNGPSQPVNMFDFATGGMESVGSVSTIIIGLIDQPYKADVSYINVKNFGVIFVSNSVANLDGISTDFLNLVNNASASSEINLLGLTTPGISVPRLKGNTNGIKYVALSGDGDVVASGGLYANIIEVGPVAHPEGYFVQENDFTIVSNGVRVNVFDPALANQNVLDKGKILNIRNIGTVAIIVDSQNNSIFDGDQTLQPGESITLQNNGTLWYRIGR